MPGLKLKLDREALDALECRAWPERKLVKWQVQLILRQLHDLSFPFPLRVKETL
jgi:hypothetical protein